MERININADDPFETLGVDPHTPLHEIKDHVQDLTSEHDTDDAIAAISEAIEEIQDGPHVKEVGGTRVEPLVVQIEDGSVAVSSSVEVRVYDIGGSPIEDAEIRVDDARKANTGPGGAATIQLSEPGTHQVQASKPHPQTNCEYQKGEATLSVRKRQRSLKISEHPTTVEVGSSREVRVTDSNDRGVQDAVIDGENIESDGTTDSNGWTSIVPTDVESGTEVVATKPDSKNRAYKSDKVTINVIAREVDLSFEDPPSKVTFDTASEFRVVDGDGDGVSGVTLSTAGETATTNNDGFATLRFDSVSPGEINVEASKDGSSDVEYASGETEVTVIPQNVELDLQMLDDEVRVGEPATVTVTDGDDAAVSGVFVTGEDSDTDTTDESGRAQLVFDNTGTKTVRASKTERTGGYKYTINKTSVSVNKRTERLSFLELPDSVDSGEKFRVQIGTPSGKPVEGVNIIAEDGTEATTNEDGNAWLSISDKGDKRVRASKPSTETVDYRGTSKKVTVVRQVSLEFASLPTEPTVDETTSVRVETDGKATVTGVTIQLDDGSQATTDDTGRAYITPSQTGETRIEASKTSESYVRYEPAVDQLSVQKRNSALEFEKLPSETTVGEPVSLRVVDDTGKPVENARVSSDGEILGTTGKRGGISTRYEELGSKTVRASKSADKKASYRSTTASFDVVRPSLSESVAPAELITSVIAGGIISALSVFLLLNTPTSVLNPAYSTLQLVIASIFVSGFPVLSYFEASRESYLATLLTTTASIGTFGSFIFLTGPKVSLFVYPGLTVVSSVTLYMTVRATELGEAGKVVRGMRILGSVLSAFIFIFATLVTMTTGNWALLIPAVVLAVGIMISTTIL